MSNYIFKKDTFEIFPELSLRFSNSFLLKEHINTEFEFWKKIDRNITESYKTVLTLITQLENDKESPKDKISTEGHIRHCLYFLDLQSNHYDKIINTCIYSKSLLGQFLKKLALTNQNDYENLAYNCVALLYGNSKIPISDITDASEILIVFDAYFFCKFNALSNNALNQYSEMLNSIFSELDQQRLNAEKFIFEKEKILAELISKNQENNLVLYNTHEKQLCDIDNKFNDQILARHRNFDDLENTYKEKLQLEAPAEYWRKMADDYKKQGKRYIMIDIALGSFFGFSLFLILINSNWIPAFNFDTWNLSTLRVCLVLLAFSSIMGYVIHIVTKLAISSFHLARDYQDRFQLTHVYLALLENASLSKNEQIRTIVMQALFCRSDTGLLKGEQSLHMPTPISEIFKENS